MLRLDKNGIMDLFEDNDHGVNANSGYFKLEKEGDKAFFCFKQDIKMIGQRLKKVGYFKTIPTNLHDLINCSV